MKKINTIFEKATTFDAKNITNKSMIPMAQEDIALFEKGITIETLDEMMKNGLKIFKYRTQITVHGLFPETLGFRVGGYANVFQNKNKSIGVKWNAIDFEKRKRMYKKLSFLGFSWHSSSNQDCFCIMESVNETNFGTVKNKLFDVYKKIDTSLFYGSSDLYTAKCQYGGTYIVLELCVNAIYEKNINTFLEKLGYSEKEHLEHLEKEKQEDEKRHLEYLAEQENKKKQKEKYINEHDDFLSVKSKYEHVEHTENTGKYIRLGFNYKNEPELTLIELKKIEKKKNLRVARKTFNTLVELLNFEGFREYSFEKTRTGYSLSGYKLV